MSPQVFSGMHSLETLHLNDNELQRLPPSLGSLPRLKEVCLQYNKITLLPAQLAQTASLQVLDLEGNPIRSTQLLQLAADSLAPGSALDLPRFRQLLLQHEAAASAESSRPLSSCGSQQGSARLNHALTAAAAAAGGWGAGVGGHVDRAGNVGQVSGREGASEGGADAAEILYLGGGDDGSYSVDGGRPGRKSAMGEDEEATDGIDIRGDRISGRDGGRGGDGLSCYSEGGEDVNPGGMINASDISVLDDVMGLPPAAAAIM